MGNILQNSLDVTYEDFLKGVFGVKAKPEWNALKTLFSEIVVGKSTLGPDHPEACPGSETDNRNASGVTPHGAAWQSCRT